MLKALLYAYVLGGLTFIPLVILGIIFVTIYTSVPVGDGDITKRARQNLESKSAEDSDEVVSGSESQSNGPMPRETSDLPRARKGWLTMRRTFEEPSMDGGYVYMVRSFLDSRSKDPKKSRPKDMWYVVLKGKVLYLYEDEEMTECEVVVELGSHDVVVYPEGQLDGELFAKRNAICLKPKSSSADKFSPNVTEDSQEEDVDTTLDGGRISGKQKEGEKDGLVGVDKRRESARWKGPSPPAPWFIFVRSNVEMEDWYLALIHASENHAQTPTLAPLQSIFQPAHMAHLVSTLDEQPDVIPMRWLNALIGRVFFSYYRTHTLEAYIIGRLMKKLSKVKRPAFLTDVVVTEVSVGNKVPMLSKPMLKELTKEGDASMEVHLQYKGEFRITIEATAIINLGQFRSYTVKLVLAAVLKELEGNLLIKIKRPPSNRIWYAFTQNPRMVLEVEPIVSDRQIKWGMILSTIESKLKEIIQESVVMPNMDDIAFFESQRYEHRGGIWPDASRSEKLRTGPTVLATDDAQSTVSAPPVLSSDPEDAPSLSQAMKGSPEPEGSISRPASVPIVQEPDASVKEQDLTDLKESLIPAPQDEQRGQLLDIHPVAQLSDNINTETYEPSDDGADSPASNLLPTHSRRSSMHSTKSHRSNKSTDNVLEPTTTPPKASDTPQSSGSTGTSPSSFLSTLKSKAGDKQALSNTAREAMRKWGVNWGNLKKEFANSEENGDLASKLRNKMDGANSKRASYAEVRAAVAERRDREREQGGQSEEEADQIRSTPSTPSAGDQKGGIVTNSPTGAGQGSQLDTSALARPTKSQSVKKPVSRIDTDIGVTADISEDEIRPFPIQAQPRAKTMIIPGIHASHRGEVMSMGNVAPQPSVLSDSVKSKNPTIQSVYRLWRGPVNTGHDRDAPAPTTQLSSEAATEGQSSEPQLPLPQESAAVRRTPPPLPPRSLPGTVPRPDNSDIGQDSPRVTPFEPAKMEEEIELPDDSVTRLSSEMSPDSSVPAATSPANTPPPLPPRRISSAA